MKPSALPLLAACLACAWPAPVVAQFLDDPPPKKPAASGEPIDPKKAIQKIEGDRYQLGTIEFNQKTREIRIPGKVNMTDGPLEYVLVHESGKVHESLLSTAARPVELNIVLLLLNWQKSQAFFDFSEPERGGVLVKNSKNPAPSHIEVHVAWKDKDGHDQTCHIENWLHQIEKKAKLTVEPFIYTGSILMPDGRWLAEETGSILALCQDPGSMINNPRDGNDLDDVWAADPDMPPKETPVTIILRPSAESKPASAPPKPKATPSKKKPAP